MDLDTLTKREREVFAAILDGVGGTKALGQRLAISPKTAEVHKARLLAKLKARSSVELLAAVIRERGLA